MPILSRRIHQFVKMTSDICEKGKRPRTDGSGIIWFCRSIYRMELEQRVRGRVEGLRTMWPNAYAVFGSNPDLWKYLPKHFLASWLVMVSRLFIGRGERYVGKSLFCRVLKLWNTKNLNQPLNPPSEVPFTCPIWKVNCVKSSPPNLSRQIP